MPVGVNQASNSAPYFSLSSVSELRSLVCRCRYDTAISPYLLRMSVGLEDVNDLKADLQAAISGGKDLLDEHPSM
jgi:cystathionine beta-lyase/cystathionine gamma-synthase|eukprot:COSAG01_NODE_888_length_12915_cov_10.708723_12_plen_75_part_00